MGRNCAVRCAAHATLWRARHGQDRLPQAAGQQQREHKAMPCTPHNNSSVRACICITSAAHQKQLGKAPRLRSSCPPRAPATSPASTCGVPLSLSRMRRACSGRPLREHSDMKQLDLSIPCETVPCAGSLCRCWERKNGGDAPPAIWAEDKHEGKVLLWRRSLRQRKQ